ncbi:Huwe1 [Symbiodinium sp. CCMP2456]|nr:Huwe1 [Symbiodinium sp. CCMP2456]
MRFDAILGAFLKSGMGFSGHPSEELVCEVLRVLHDVLLLHQELKGPVEKLRDLLQCSELRVLLGVLRCLAACPPSRHLQAGHAASLERRLEVLACGGGYLETGSFRDACTSEDYVLEDFRVDSAGEGDAQPSEFKAGADSGDFEELRRQLEAQRGEPCTAFPEQLLQLRLWCRARSLEGRREVVAIALLAICNVVKHIRASVLQQYLQKRPGLLSELCEMLQSLQSVGTDAGIAALRVTAAFLDARFGQSRSEASQLSQMLPHGIVACALRGLLGHRPADDQLEAHNAVLSAALDLFQITTVNNHQSSAQLGHAGMILAMLELMQRTDVPSLAAVASMLRCLELAAEVSSTAALVLFRDFNGLQAFSLRLQREVELLMVLEFTGDALEMEPPPTTAPPEERQRFRALLEEVTARRRLCRQLLKNIQTALQCSEVLQAGLANIFQGPMMDALKVAVKAPVRVGLSLFGTAIDIVSSVIQDDPSRVPQLIETNVLPAVLGVLSKETMRSTECLSFVPGILASVALHAVGEDFILGLASKPIQLVIDVLVDPSFVPLLYSQPELIQIMSTQMDKVLRNRPTGMCKLTEHVVESMLSSLRAILEQAKAYPDWTPWDLEDHTGYLPDRLAPFSRFCWSLLSTNEHVLKCFIEKQGLSLVRDIQELPCLPYFFTSLEGQQHPVASLFNLQAKCEDGGAAVGAELKEMLSTNLEKVLPILKECAAGDPHVVMSSMETSQVLAFLQALSRVCSVLEDLLSIAREGSSLQVMEAVRQFLAELAPLAALIFVVAAWQPHDRERMPPTACYHESTKQVFTPSSKEDAAGSASVQGGGGGESPILRAARVGFRLTCRTLRQLMQLSSKLQTRVRREASAVVPFTMARCLAQVAKAVLVAPRPPSSSVALRWVAEVFDLLQKMHEEQNKVALRSLALCAFYQAGCFEMLQPLIQMSLEKIGDSKEDLAAGTALSAALGYFEKVTSTRRFANAYLRDEAMMSKEMLCKSIQAEALRCLLPVWRHPQFANFPRSSCCSLLKVWLHLLQEPKSEPRTPDWHRLSSIPALPNIAGMQHVQHVQQEMVRTADGGRVPDAAASLMANDPAIIAVSGTSVPTAGTAGTAATASTPARAPTGTADVTNIQGTLVDMGFSRTQVDAAQRHFGSRGTEDISEMIVWMVANPTVDGEVSETLRQPVVQEEFQTLLAGLLDVGWNKLWFFELFLPPRFVLREVQKALNAVVDTICYVAENPSPFWERHADEFVSPGDGDSNSKATAVDKGQLGDAGGRERLVSHVAIGMWLSFVPALPNWEMQMVSQVLPETLICVTQAVTECGSQDTKMILPEPELERRLLKTLEGQAWLDPQEEQEIQETKSTSRRRQWRLQREKKLFQLPACTFLESHGFSSDVCEPRVPAGCMLFRVETLYPIHVAAQKGECEVVRMLIAAGADPSQRTSRGRTAVDFAVKSKSPHTRQVLELLRSQGRVLCLRDAVNMMQNLNK